MDNLNVKKLYSYIIFAIDGFASEDTLDRRKYIHYMNIVKECSEDCSKLKLKDNVEILKEIAKCQKCKCF